MLSILAESATEATVLVGASLMSLLLLRRAPARLRSLVLGIALAGTLVLPAASWLLPEIAVPVPWLTTNDASPSAVPAVDVNPAVNTSSALVVPRRTERAESLPAAPSAARPQLAPKHILGGVWLLGVLAVLVHLGVGWARASRLVRTSRRAPVNTDIAERWSRCQKRLELQKTRLRLSPRLSTPATWGWLRPVVLMPEEATTWDPDAIEVALLHEAVHVSRCDWLVRTAARLACAVHWFNPLIWWATRRLTIEQEHACDDAIVAHGSRPSTYAAHLLAIAHRAAPRPAALAAALGMANRSQLEERIMSILNDRPSRRVSITALVVAAVCSIALVPTIAAIAPTASTTEDLTAAHTRQDRFAPEAPVAPSAAPDPVAAPAEPAPHAAPHQAPPAPPAPAASPELRALSRKILELEQRIEEQVESSEWSIELERITEQLEPHHEQLEALHEQIEPYTEEIERLAEAMTEEMSEAYEVELTAGLEEDIARMSAEMARLGAEIARSIEGDLENLNVRELQDRLDRQHAQITAQSRELQRRIEETVKPRMDAIQLRNQERIAELQTRITELTAEIGPTTQHMHELELDMEPFREQMEKMQRELEPLTDEIEELSNQLERELGAEVRSRLTTHLGAILGPAAPIDEAVARILDEARIQLDDDRVRLRVRRSEVEEILTDLLADDRVGASDAFDAAVEQAAQAIHRIELQL